MAMFSEVKAKLGLDISDFQKGMGRAVQSAGTAADSVARKFSAKQIGTSLATALGLNLVNLANKLVEPFEVSAKAAERVASETERAAAATERLIQLRQTDIQQLSTLEKQFRRLNDEREQLLKSGPQSRFFGFIQRGSGLDALFGLSRRSDARLEEARAENQRKLQEKGGEVDAKREEIRKKAAAEREKVEQRAVDAEVKRLRAQEERAEIERQERLARLSDEDKAAALQRRRAEVAKEIANIEKFEREARREGENLTAEGIELLLSLKAEQKSIDETLTELAEQRAAAEKKASAAVQEQTEGMRTQFEIRGRENELLSDRELMEKERNLRRELFRSDMRDANPLGLALGDSVYSQTLDPLRFFKEDELGRLQAERRLRRTARDRVAFFGEEAAASQLGITDDRLASILGTLQDQKLMLSELRTLNRNLIEGRAKVQSVTLNPRTPAGGP